MATTDQQPREPARCFMCLAVGALAPRASRLPPLCCLLLCCCLLASMLLAAQPPRSTHPLIHLLHPVFPPRTLQRNRPSPQSPRRACVETQITVTWCWGGAEREPAPNRSPGVPRPRGLNPRPPRVFCRREPGNVNMIALPGMDHRGRGTGGRGTAAGDVGPAMQLLLS